MGLSLQEAIDLAQKPNQSPGIVWEASCRLEASQSDGTTIDSGRTIASFSPDFQQAAPHVHPIIAGPRLGFSGMIPYSYISPNGDKGTIRATTRIFKQPQVPHKVGQPTIPAQTFLQIWLGDPAIESPTVNCDLDQFLGGVMRGRTGSFFGDDMKSTLYNVTIFDVHQALF